MIPTLKTLIKTALFRVRVDPASGHSFYSIGGVKVFVRSARECDRPHHRKYALEQIYFKHYWPKDDETVVDFGAGLGTEIVGLAARSPRLKYIAVEIQPSVYECLCLTLAQLPAGFVPYGLAVGAEPVIRITPTRAGIDATTSAEGTVPVEGITWTAFLARHGIDQIDLLKVNIEGGETHLLQHIDLDRVKRVIISVHDFRADQGGGEQYRTRALVEKTLEAAGFRLVPIGGKEAWMRSWIFADRSRSGG